MCSHILVLFFVGGTAGNPVQRPGIANPCADSGFRGIMKGGVDSRHMLWAPAIQDL